MDQKQMVGNVFGVTFVRLCVAHYKFEGRGLITELDIRELVAEGKLQYQDAADPRCGIDEEEQDLIFLFSQPKGVEPSEFDCFAFDLKNQIFSFSH